MSTRAKGVTVGIAVIAIGGIVGLRSCGAVSLPAKPPAPVATTRDLTKALAATASTTNAWTVFAKQDAAAAAIVGFDPASMTKAFPYQSDRARHVLTPAQPVTVAGLTLSAAVEVVAGQRVLTLTIDNPSATAIAYRVATTTSAGASDCTQRHVLGHNAIVVGPHAQVRRTECKYDGDLALIVTAVDALSVPPLAARYLSQISPSALVLDERTAKGHERAPGGCEIHAWPALVSAVAEGTTTFRDLADFYGRHRCESYKFFIEYRHFQQDGERGLPVVPAS